MEPPVQFALVKNGLTLRKVGGVFPAAVVCPSMAKTDKDEALEHLHLVDEVSSYIPYGVEVPRWMRKRAICTKAKMFARN